MAKFYLQPLHNGRWRFVIKGANPLVSKSYRTERRAEDALYACIMDMVESPVCRGKYTFLDEHVGRLRRGGRRLEGP
jgi:hypothetical protein